MKTISSGNNQENALLWLIKLLSGGLILFILTIHLVVNHLVAPGGLFTFKDVIAYYQSPLVLVMEGFFLTFVLVHALLGLRSILLDLNPAPKIVRIINIILTITGILALVYGIWLLIAVSAMPVLP